jgi:hypothetical protein
MVSGLAPGMSEDLWFIGRYLWLINNVYLRLPVDLQIGNRQAGQQMPLPGSETNVLGGSSFLKL